jgi:2-oxoglutarate ferredoxin oxidoreductase subunit delta
MEDAPMRPVSPRRPVDSARVTLPRGEVFVIPDRCKGCRFCIEFCPNDVLAESTAINAKGYHYPVVAAPQDDLCAHCEFCTLVCPEFAIFTRSRVERLEAAS